MRPLSVGVLLLALILAACAEAAPVSVAVFDGDHASALATEVVATEYGHTVTGPLQFDGRVELLFRNNGTEKHELYVVPYDSGRYGAPVAEIELLEPGREATLVADLPAGEYRLVCLAISEVGGSPVSHMELGEETAMTVR